MNRERALQVLTGPHVSEKATVVGDLANQYVFKVTLDATRLEVKRAVERLFKVEVAGVRTLRVKGKARRNRFGRARRPDWKKAYVRLGQGHEIDLLASE